MFRNTRTQIAPRECEVVPRLTVVIPGRRDPSAEARSAKAEAANYDAQLRI